MLKRCHKEPTDGGCTAVCNVVLDKSYTLKEFINTVISQYPNEYGWFRLIRNGEWKSLKVISYREGNLIKEIPADVVDMEVKSVKLSSISNQVCYIIIIGGND